MNIKNILNILHKPLFLTPKLCLCLFSRGLEKRHRIVQMVVLWTALLIDYLQCHKRHGNMDYVSIDTNLNFLHD